MLKTVDEVIQDLEGAGMIDLLRLMESPVSTLYNIQIASLLQRMPTQDQMLALACQVGAMWAMLEGRANQHEKEGGEMMTLDKHTRLFVAAAHAAYRTVLDERILHEEKMRDK